MANVMRSKSSLSGNTSANDIIVTIDEPSEYNFDIKSGHLKTITERDTEWCMKHTYISNPPERGCSNFGIISGTTPPGPGNFL
jgi:hypothetical protein